MDVFERAHRRYCEVVPDDLVGAKPARRRQRISAPKIEAWITDYVVPAIVQ